MILLDAALTRFPKKTSEVFSDQRLFTFVRVQVDEEGREVHFGNEIPRKVDAEFSTPN